MSNSQKKRTHTSKRGKKPEARGRRAWKTRDSGKTRLATPRQRLTGEQRLAKAAKALANSTLTTNILYYADGLQDENRRFAEKEFGAELALCKALIAASGWFAMALAMNRGGERLYPRDWIEAESAGNPDIVMSGILCQVANYGYSVVGLVEQGLDTPARALLRSTADLCFALAILSNDREALQTYVLDKSLSEKERWYTLFSNRKLAARLREIDRALGVPEEVTKAMEDYRLRNNEFFQKPRITHSSAILIGSYPCNPRTGMCTIGLFGGPIVLFEQRSVICPKF